MMAQLAEGSVWYVSTIRVKPGMIDAYMREVLPMREKMNEEAKQQGLLLSSRSLCGRAAGRDDFNVMFLDEYKDWAAFDGLNAKWTAIQHAIAGSEDEHVGLLTKWSELREVLNEKRMVELASS